MINLTTYLLNTPQPLQKSGIPCRS